ncbi:MAG: hypothetical protein H7301_13140 [Cryobacterium sp.]|nr:hypothetical protein [Oligoflexia bacterium]
MDLGQDWGALNRILYPRRKTKGSSQSPHVFIAHHADRTLRIVGDRDELLYATGTPLGEATAAAGSDRKTVAIDIVEMDRALNECLKSDGGIYDQGRDLRNVLSVTKGRLPAVTEHFLFTALRAWWGKFLPSHFGIYLHLEGTEPHDARTLLLIFRKGELTEFDEPDLSAVSQERRADLSEVVKVLRERYRVPVQGFAMNRADFQEWSEAGDTSHTWKNVAKALRHDRLQLVPFRFSLAAVLGSRGIFSV